MLPRQALSVAQIAPLKRVLEGVAAACRILDVLRPALSQQRHLTLFLRAVNGQEVGHQKSFL